MKGIPKNVRIHSQAMLSTFTFVATLEVLTNELLLLPFIETILSAQGTRAVASDVGLNAHNKLLK